ncbi:hypothetical protein FB45DRAFT_191422 [Roridomyces roridus]|uniref:Mid2 domain-containing protein n=1 Tax=Roridomyces roridus TaxID=1738132 RepID=A0AAD7CFD8_9AGAR|nr:hypothetical protein FB45DRAFT_191422 [Roridomyces roridus]
MTFIPRQGPISSPPAASSAFPTSLSAAVPVQSDSQRRASEDSVSASSAPASPSNSANNASSSQSSIPPSSSSGPPSSSAPPNPPSSSSAPPPSSSQPAPSSSSIVPPSSSAPPPSSSSPPPSSSSPPPSSSSAAPPPTSTSESPTPASTSAGDSVSAAPSTTVITSTLADGDITTFVSQIPPPTSLSTAGPTASSRRTAVIAGATAAGVGIILLLLAAVFVYKRHKSRRLDFFEAIGRVRREATGAGGAGLLDDEGFDEDDNVPMRRYRDNAPTGHSRSTSTIGPPQSPTPSLFRQRAETGSLFREEGVWPPPQGSQFVDPLVGVGATEGLARIVDEVMGPEPAHHNKDIPTMSSASTSLYNDPFRDTSHTHGRQPSDPSLYFDRRDASTSSTGSLASGTGSRPQSLLGLPAGAALPPKKSSPLVNTTPPSPTTTSTWLSRSPKKPGSSPLLHDA